MNWLEVFSETKPDRPGAATELIDFEIALRAPLSDLELKQAGQNPRIDPTTWKIPQGPLPDSYRSLLQWSNGAWCRTGEREFGFFCTDDPNHGVRAMLLGYELPYYMPGALPFAFDGGGTFYLFDMRQDAVNGEHPIVCAHAGYLDWEPEACWKIADSFLEACRDSRRIDNLRPR
jgi:hypothetical protein